MIETKPTTWFPYADPIHNGWSSTSPLTGGDYYWSHGLDELEFDEQHGVICVVLWQRTFLSHSELEPWSVSFIPEPQFKRLISDMEKANTVDTVKVIGAIQSTDVRYDTLMLYEFYRQHPLYKNAVYIDNAHDQAELLEIVSSSHIKNNPLARVHFKNKKLQDELNGAISRIESERANSSELQIRLQNSDSELRKIRHENASVQLENAELRKELNMIKRQLSPIKRDGYVYLLRVVDTDNTYKIGRTKNPDNRLKTFSVKLPFRVEYTHLIKCSDMYELESQLHARYKDKRQNGSEFFILSDSNVSEIQAIESE